MTIKEEFENIVVNSLFLLNSQVIVPYVVNCFSSLNTFISEKTHRFVRFSYENTDLILQSLYKIGIENCKKEYNYYNSMLNFKSQYEIDYKLMRQIRQKHYNSHYFDEINQISINDKEFYVKKYKFYNSFKITLS